MEEIKHIGFIETYRAKQIESIAPTLDYYIEEFIDTLGVLKQNSPSDYHRRSIDRMTKMLKEPKQDITKYFQKFFTLTIALQSCQEILTDHRNNKTTQNKITTMLINVTKLIDDNRLLKEVKNLVKYV